MIDTRKLGRSRASIFDGFVHLVPRWSQSLHTIDVRCWCDPKLLWLEDAGTVLVSHRDKHPGPNGWAETE